MERWRDALESLLLPLLALAGGVLLFGGFLALGGHDPLQAWALLLKGAFGDAFSWQNTLQRAAKKVEKSFLKFAHDFPV
jgi:simple sugar transport system permease protein